jgi:hypothetical protein
VWKALATDATSRTPSALVFRKELEQAFRSVGPIADARELGEYASAIFGPKLEERSQAAAEIRKLRARMGEIARPSDTDASAFGQSIVERTPESGERTRADAPAVRGAREASAPVAAAPAAVPTIQDSSAHIPEAELIARYTRRSRGKKLAAGAVALGAALAAVGWFTTRGTHEVTKPAVQQSPAPTIPVAATETETAHPVSLDDLERPEDSAQPEYDGTKSTPGTSGAALHARQRKAPAPVNTAVAAPKSKAPPKLARDPYGGTK